jgi:hypothetical protein
LRLRARQGDAGGDAAGRARRRFHGREDDLAVALRAACTPIRAELGVE